MSTKGVSTGVIVGIVAVIVVAVAAFFLLSAPGGGETRSFTVTAVELEGGALALDPDTITVNRGDTVEITFENPSGNTEVHNFYLLDFGVSTTDILPGESAAKVTFTADEDGAFDYFCNVSGHRPLGMEGTLRVIVQG
ncbi:MAG: cupredoxin domain-containing protein [Candidatus Geothermarchaeales archaeon]